MYLADFALQLGRPADAEVPARESVDVARSSKKASLLVCLAILAETLALLDAPDAQQAISEAREWIDGHNYAGARPQLLRAIGLTLMQHDELQAAIAQLTESATLARVQTSFIQLGRTLDVLARAARLYGDERLAAAADVERAALIEQIGPEVRVLAWAGGSSVRRRPSTKGSGNSVLSPREVEVARLIARGLTDRQIAERLVITEGTAGVHVGHILNKLGFHNRAEIASWAALDLAKPDTAP
jgi:DNA-binding CsgD family transcriptional regulator